MHDCNETIVVMDHSYVQKLLISEVLFAMNSAPTSIILVNLKEIAIEFCLLDMKKFL